MLRQFGLLLGFCSLAAIAVFFLRLSPTVRFEAYIAQLDPPMALAQLDQAASQTELSANLILMRADLALRSGDLQTARAAIEGLGRDKALRAIAEERLAEIERVAGDIARAADHLEAAYSIDPTPERRLTLGGWYRVLRRPNEEVRLLQSVPPNSLTAWEAERLFDLLQHAGHFDLLEATLKTMAARGGKEVELCRSRLINLLLTFGRSAEVVDMAWRWFVDEHDPRALEIAAEDLIARGALREAIALTDHALAENPKSTHPLILVFVRSGHGAVARAFQRRWLERNQNLEEPEWRTLLEFAEITGDLSGLRVALDRAPDNIDPRILAPAIGQFLRYRGPLALVEHRRRLTPDLFKEAPLIGAAWMAEQGRQEALFAYLIAAAASPMSGWERDAWLSLAKRLDGTSGYRSLLEYFPANHALRAALIQQIIAKAAIPPP